MADIFFALSHLHKHGLVHNDVKLENVLFQHPEAEEQAVGGGARGKCARTLAKGAGKCNCIYAPFLASVIVFMRHF